MRLRSTPMNHRNAIPPNGTRLRANRTALRRCGSVSQIPGRDRSAGTAYRTSPSPTMVSNEKITPATAAPRGGFRACWRWGFGVLVTLTWEIHLYVARSGRQDRCCALRPRRTQHLSCSSIPDGRSVGAAPARVHQCPHHRVQVEGGGLLTRRELPEVLDLLGYHRLHSVNDVGVRDHPVIVVVRVFIKPLE